MPMNGRLLRPRQTIHPEAADWANRVRTNGGSVSGTTLNAVDRFVKAIHAAGIRDRFFRVNLFCGNSDASLAAVRTPLFRGQSLTGTQYGNTTDTNAGNLFVANDYAETGASGGLIGNGSSKYLATGLPQDFAGNTGHASVYHRGTIATAGAVFLRVVNATDRVGVDFGVGANAVRNWWGPNSGSGIAYAFGTAGGHLIGSRTASNRNDAYRNGVADGFSTENVTMSLSGAPCQFLVFASGDANGNPQAGTYTAARLQGYSLGASLTASQAAAFSTAMIAFQTALGRN